MITMEQRFWRYDPHWHWPEQGVVAGQTSKAESQVWLLSPLCVLDPEQGVHHVYQRIPTANNSSETPVSGGSPAELPPAVSTNTPYESGSTP